MSSTLLEQIDTPPPLHFFNEYIHPKNRELIDTEEKRWRLLGTLERWKLQRYVAGLARELKRGKWNERVLELERLRKDIRRAKRAYATAADTTAKAAAKAEALRIIEAAKPVAAALRAMKETHEAYTHYRGWLEYEAEHREELKRHARLEQQTNSAMRKEAKWIEKILRDVWRKNPKCHYIRKENGKEVTIVPRFYLSEIMPDAHVFYLETSRKTLFGWRWLLPYGVNVADLISPEVLENMRSATTRQVDAIVTPQNQVTIRVARLDSPDALPKSVPWRDVVRLFPEEDRDKLPYPVGVNEARNVIWFDFATAHHILVAGKSGSGKSNLVNAIVGTLASTYTPEELRIVMIDMKGGVEFGHWHELPHVLGDVIKTIDGVKPLLQRLVNIMDRRYALMEKVKAKDINKYNRKVDIGNRFARVLILMDEMNTFLGMKETSEIHNLITLLASKGRAVGFNIIAATQHPDKDVIPGRIKTNMDIRLCGFMPSVVASHIVLDGPEAANIANLPGRFVAQRGLETRTVQVPFISDEDIEGVVSSCLRAYPEVKEDLPETAGEPKVTAWTEQRMMEEALTLLDGHLSAQKLHKLLGDEESPGERELARIYRRILDVVEAVGYIERESDGSKWTLKKRGKAYFLIAWSDRSDRPDTSKPGVIEAISSDQASDHLEHALPSMVVEAGAAAD